MLSIGEGDVILPSIFVPIFFGHWSAIIIIYGLFYVVFLSKKFVASTLGTNFRGINFRGSYFRGT